MSLSTDSSTSASLIRRVQQDDRAAWERLSLLYGPVVYDWARRQGLQSQDAADVMQDVFKALTRRIAAFTDQPGGSFRGWLWTVTRNTVRDHFRRTIPMDAAAGGTAHLNLLEQMVDEPPSPDSVAGQAEQSGIYRRALELMKTDFEEQTWRAFWRTTVDELRPADVAAEMGISKWSVYKARSRVLQRLRDEFEDLL